MLVRLLKLFFHKSCYFLRIALYAWRIMPQKYSLVTITTSDTIHSILYHNPCNTLLSFYTFTIIQNYLSSFCIPYKFPCKSKLPKAFFKIFSCQILYVSLYPKRIHSRRVKCCKPKVHKNPIYSKSYQN